MTELQLRRVQKITRQVDCSRMPARLLWSTIHRIAYHGMSHRRHVYANLVSAAGSDLHVQQGEFAERRIETARHALMGHRRPSTLELCCHPRAPYPVAADALGERCGIFFHPAVYQGEIFLLYFPRGELRAQLAMGLVVFGDHN